MLELQFFDGYTWEQLVAMLFSFIFGLWPGFNIFQWLKDKWNIYGQKAHFMVLGVSIVLTVTVMLVTGYLDFAGFEFTLANILEYATLVYVGSQIAYKRFLAARLAD